MHTIRVELCLGSSCFARGNARTLEILENTIKQKGLEKKVELIGHLCLGSCSVGPAIRIEGVDYYGLEEKQIVDLLQLKLTEKGELA